MTGAELTSMLDNLLTVSVGLLTAPPARQMVVHGAWAHDCECVAVQLADYSVESAVNAHCAWNDVLAFEVTVLRCLPTPDEHGKAPAAATLTTSSHEMATDAGDLVIGLLDAWADKLLFPSIAELVECGAVRVLGARPRGPEAGLGGWTVSLTVRP